MGDDNKDAPFRHMFCQHRKFTLLPDCSKIFYKRNDFAIQSNRNKCYFVKKGWGAQKNMKCSAVSVKQRSCIRGEHIN